MENDYKEPEETGSEPIQQAEVIPDHQMLTSEPVIDRSHASSTQTGTETREWTPPTPDPNAFVDPAQENGEGKQPEPPKSPFANADLDDATEEEKADSATNMARGIFMAIDTAIRDISNFALPLREKKMKFLEDEGLVDWTIQARMRDGSVKTQGEIIEEANVKMRDKIFLSEDYIDAGVPILAKELKKRSMGLTDTQMFLYVHTPMEIKRIGGVAFELKGYLNEVVESLKENTAAHRQAFGSTPGPAAPAAAATRPATTHHEAHVNEPGQVHVQEPIDEAVQQQVYPHNDGTLREQSLASEFDNIQSHNAAGNPGIITNDPVVTTSGSQSSVGRLRAITRRNRKPAAKKSRKKR